MTPLDVRVMDLKSGLNLFVLKGEPFLLDYRDFDIYVDEGKTVTVVDKGFTVSVDPQENFSKSSADLILVTSEEHYNHSTVERLCGKNTCVVVPSSLEEDIPCQDTERIQTGEVMDIFGIEVEAHSLGDGIGYRFVMRGTSFYVSGDTDSIENSQELESRINICFLSLKDLEPEEVVKAAVRIKPEKTVPYLFGGEEPDLKGLSAELEDRSVDCSIP